MSPENFPCTFSASMMCADQLRLQSEIADLEKAGVDRFHLDVMDGAYVANLALGVATCEAIRSASSLPIDLHLMVRNPLEITHVLKKVRPDRILIHPDSLQSSWQLSEIARVSGSRICIVIETEKDLRELSHPECTGAMIMTTETGWTGRGFIKSRIRLVNEITQRFAGSLEIGVDGGIGVPQIHALARLGVTEFVLGTSILFGHGSYAQTLRFLRRVESTARSQRMYESIKELM